MVEQHTDATAASQNATTTTRPPVANRTDRSQTEGMHRETSGSSSNNSFSDRRRASSVQRGRFLVQKAPENGVDKSHANGAGAPSKPPEKKGRFLVQQVSDGETSNTVPKGVTNTSMESTMSLGNSVPIPKPKANDCRSISDPSSADHHPEDPRQEYDRNNNRKTTVQKGRFLVQSQQQQDDASTSTRSMLPLQHNGGTAANTNNNNNNPAIPIGVIPGNQVVREKKGRFSVLEPNAVPPPTETGHTALNSHLTQQQQLGHGTTTASSGMEGPMNGPSANLPAHTFQHAAPNQKGMAATMQQKTNQQPVVKMQGRFVVSNMPVQATVYNNYQQQEYHTQQPENNVTMVYAPDEAAFAPTGALPMDPAVHAQQQVDPNQQFFVAAGTMPPPPPPSNPPPPQLGIETPLSSTSSIHKHYVVPEPSSCAPSPMVTAHKTDDGSTTAKHNNTSSLAQPRRGGGGADAGPNVKQRFGKMILFLDQMRSEVTEADRNIKTMQTNMKCMRERNKELEAQLREMEKKYQHEKAAREAAESKVKALKKKVRAQVNNTTTSDAVERKAEESSACSSLQHGDKLSRTNSLDGIQEVSESAVSGDQSSSFSKIEMASSNGSSAPAAPTSTQNNDSTTAHPAVERTKSSDVSPPRGHFNSGQNATTPSSAVKQVRGVARSASESSSHQHSSVVRQQQQPRAMDESAGQPIGVLHQQALAKSHPDTAGRHSSEFDPLRPSHSGHLDNNNNNKAPPPPPVVVMNVQPTVAFMTELDRGSNATMMPGGEPMHPQQNGHRMQGMFVGGPQSAPAAQQHDAALHHRQQQQHSFVGQPTGSNQSTFGSQCTQTSHPSVLNQDLLHHAAQQLHDPFDELVQTRSKTGK